MKVKPLPTNTTTPPAFYLIYGHSGTRKSTLCATFGELGKTLVIDADQGYQTYAYCPYIKKEWRDNLEFVDVSDFLDFDSIYEMLLKKSYKQKLGLDFTPQYVILDTYTAMEPLIVQKIAQVNGVKGGNSLKDFQEKFGYTEWGMLKEYHLKYLRAMKQIVQSVGTNIVYVMQETMDKDELSGQTYGGPKTTGKAWLDFPEAFDVVIRTTTNLQGQSVATTLSKGKFPAKNRLTGVGKEITASSSKEPIITMKDIMQIA